MLSKSRCDEHLAVGQQRRRVEMAYGGKAAGLPPGAARWVKRGEKDSFDTRLLNDTLTMRQVR
jgi:hypothetical protein